MDVKRLLDENTSDYERTGIMQHSVLSSIAMFGKFGANSNTLYAYQQKIDCISTTLWSMLPLAIKSAEGHTASITEFKNMKKQVIDTLSELMVSIDKLHADIKDDNNES